MDKLVGLIREVQQRAKQKHAAPKTTALHDYAVGEKWYNSRAVLEQTATNILARLRPTRYRASTPPKSQPSSRP